MNVITRKFHFIFSRFQRKLLLAFLLCTLLPLFVIGCISYGVSYSIAYDKIMDSAILAADQIHVQLSGRIRQTENVADALQYGMYTLESSNEQELSSYLETLTSLRNNISLYKSTFDLGHICVFLRDGKFGSEEGLYFFPLKEIGLFSINEQDLTQLGASSLWLYRKDLSLPFLVNAQNKQANYLICTRALHNQGSGRLDYAYFILVDAADISELLSGAFSNTEILSYLVTDEGIPAAVSAPSIKEKSFSKEEIETLTAHAGSCLIKDGCYIYTLLLDNGWLQVTEIPQDYITGGTSLLLRSILAALLLTLPVTVVTILLISRSLSRRINTLFYAMEAVRLHPGTKNDTPIAIPRGEDPALYDEIDNLGIAFEQMQNTIQKNLRSILDLSLTEERLKYQLLQSQINPHFLYNILGSIKTCQSLGKLDIASQMITDLTRFYRLTLRKSKELILLKDELEIASLYLNMEKLCHNSNLEWEFDLEDGIDNFMICRFTLQPFLENCIHHGISARTPNLFIRISAVYGDDTIIITIEDNGAGIPPERLSDIWRDLNNKTVNYEKHFGICNVNARISSELYGNGHIEIMSTLGKGTCVTIEYAQLEEEEVR